jgi:hypothetical protein
MATDGRHFWSEKRATISGLNMTPMGGLVLTWAHITDPETVRTMLPAWFGTRMIGLRGKFGLLLATGDVMRITTIMAAHRSSEGETLMDVLLDHAGVPDGVDLAWQSKHYLGAPVPGATLATVTLSQVVAAIEFAVAEIAEPPSDAVVTIGDEIALGSAEPGSELEAIARTE